MWRWKVNRVATHRKISAPEYEIFALTLAMSSRLNKGANMSSVLGVFSFKCILKKNKLPQGQKCETQRSEPRWRQRISLASCWREKRQRISLVCTATCHNYVNIIEDVQLRHLWKHCPHHRCVVLTSCELVWNPSASTSNLRFFFVDVVFMVTQVLRL